MIGEGRIVKASLPLDAATPKLQVPNESRPQVMPRSVAAAHEQAAAIKRRALTECAELRAQTEVELNALRVQTQADGRAAGYAELAALLLKQKAREAEVETAALGRVSTIARLLAERIIGQAVVLDPALLGSMALTALDEVRGARQIQIYVHPADELHVARPLAALRLPSASVSVVCDAQLAPGQLRITTDNGAFQADLGQRLDLLRDALDSSALP
jgi:flagellar biosynthesis/type III secretory pathway protein FliH